MNADEPTLEDLIDRLVDDELDPASRRALLERLDADPGAWRRCALAFLEQQAWRSALVPWAADAGVDRNATGGHRRAPGALVGIAASLFAAFALGWSVRGGAISNAPVMTVAPVATKQPGHAAADAPGPNVEATNTDGDAAVAVAVAGTVPTATTRANTFLAPETVLRLQQRGYEVEPPQRRLIGLELEDGRKVAVPVEEVRLHYIGNQTF